jgi:hypothetical protein
MEGEKKGAWLAMNFGCCASKRDSIDEDEGRVQLRNKGTCFLSCLSYTLVLHHEVPIQEMELRTTTIRQHQHRLRIYRPSLRGFKVMAIFLSSPSQEVRVSFLFLFLLSGAISVALSLNMVKHIAASSNLRYMAYLPASYSVISSRPC